MLNQLLHILLLFCCLIATASSGDLALDLDQSIETELLPSSQYFQDHDSEYDASSIKQLPDAKWSAFHRKQFRFGLTSNPIWVKTSFVTTGLQARYIALDLHGVIDHIQLQVSDSDGQIQNFKFGKGSDSSLDLHHRSNHNIGKKADTDHVHLLLLPDKKYNLLLRINSKNAVIGSFRAVDPHILDLENQTRANGVIIYLFLVFLVAFYSCAIYISTGDKAFFFHILYTLSVTGYLLNSYGFLESWLGISDLNLLQNLLLFSVSGTLLSMIAFIRAMAGPTYDKNPFMLRMLYHLFLVIGIATMCLAFVIPYDSAIRFLVAEISLAMILSPLILFHRPKHLKHSHIFIDTRLLRLRMTLFTFTLVGGIHVCTRLGLIDVYWFTNYILFLFILIEACVFAAVIFINISNDKKALFRKTFFNRQSKLPNSKALKAHFSRTTSSTNLALVYFWVAGFDKLEIASGSTRYSEFLSAFGNKLTTQLNRTDYVIPCNESDYGKLAVFHTGKNNFAILCERLNYKNQQSLYRLINDSLDLSEHQNYNNTDFKVIIGMDGFYPAQDDYETVTQNCLLALAQGIKNNTNIKNYDESIRTDKSLRRRLTNDFDESLKANELFLLWQPQYDVKSKKVLGVEVFSRWQHPKHGLILPNVFIPLLEKSNRICSLTEWIIKEVFAALPAIHRKIPDAEVSINLSSRDLINSDLITFLDEQTTLNSGLAPYIIFEITESVMIDDFSIALENIKELQLLGFKVSVENFGSGLASFSFLQTIPTNELKIDKSFSDRFTEPKTYAILSNIIKLAQRLDIRLVIEGLETKQQVELFTELGAGRLQGWAISKPLLLTDLLNEPNLAN